MRRSEIDPITAELPGHLLEKENLVNTGERPGSQCYRPTYIIENVRLAS